MILARSTYNQLFTVPEGKTKLTTKLTLRKNTTGGVPVTEIERIKTVPLFDIDGLNLQFDLFIKDSLVPKPVWFAGTSGIIDSLDLSSLFATINFNFEDVAPANKIVNTLCTKGWYEYTQGLNSTTTKRFLTPSNFLQVERGQPIVIPLHVTEAAEVRVTYGAGTAAFAVATSTLNTKRIQYLFFDEYDADDKYITVSYEGATEQGDITVEIIDECKYDVKQLVYLNRYGVFQQLFCFKQSVKSVRTSNETFKNAFISNGSYDTTKHQYKDFNKQGRESLEVSTGFVKEEQNLLIEDLMFSEDVYLREGSTFIPVNLDQNSLTFLTRKVDKVLNYTFDFEYSFDKITNI